MFCVTYDNRQKEIQEEQKRLQNQQEDLLKKQKEQQEQLLQQQYNQTQQLQLQQQQLLQQLANNLTAPDRTERPRVKLPDLPPVSPPRSRSISPPSHHSSVRSSPRSSPRDSVKESEKSSSKGKKAAIRSLFERTENTFLLSNQSKCCSDVLIDTKNTQRIQQYRGDKETHKTRDFGNETNL